MASNMLKMIVEKIESGEKTPTGLIRLRMSQIAAKKEFQNAEFKYFVKTTTRVKQ